MVYFLSVSTVIYQIMVTGCCCGTLCTTVLQYSTEHLRDNLYSYSRVIIAQIFSIGGKGIILR